MIDPAQAAAGTAAAPRLQLVSPASPSGAEPAAAPTRADGAPAPSAKPATRVYVDRSEGGVYVYRLVDVATGRVLAELPREGAQSLKVLDAYAPGAVTSASA